MKLLYDVLARNNCELVGCLGIGMKL